MKVLVDADLVIVAYLNQGEWEKEVETLWDMMESGQIQGHITEFGLDKVRFVVSKIKTPKLGDDIFFDIQEIIQVLPTKCDLFEKASELNFLDFESALEVVYAIAENLGAVVTLTPENYLGSTLPVLSVSSLLKRQRLESLAFSVEQEIETMPSEHFVAKILPAENSQEPVELIKWLENCLVKAYQAGWQPLEEILIERKQFPSVRSLPYGAVRAKKFEFNSGFLMALVVHIIPQISQELDIIDIGLEVIAINSPNSNLITGTIKILPEDLLFVVLNESGSEVMKMKARQQDSIMRLHFEADRGDIFTVKFVLANQIFIEKFIL